MAYEPTWESVSTHPLPEWYDDAKLGIFLHWGLYSVPGWAPQGRTRNRRGLGSRDLGGCAEQGVAKNRHAAAQAAMHIRNDRCGSMGLASKGGTGASRRERRTRVSA